VQLLKEYKDYTDVFLEKNALKLPDFTRVEHAISIEEGKRVLFSSIYSLLASVRKLTNETVRGGRYRWYVTNTDVGSVSSTVATVR
jgi:hypothetical protein